MNNYQKNNWYRKNVAAQNAYLNDLADWTDDDTLDDATEVLGPQVVDFDELETQRALFEPLEQGELPSIGEDELSSYMVDDLVELDENTITDNEVEEGYYDGTYIPSEEELQEKGIEPVEDTGEVVDEVPDDVPDFGGDHESALRWAIDNNRVVKLSYLTLGKKRGRGGKQYLKREMADDRVPGTGINIWRIVEPHHVSSAKNGHDILVTYDRSVRHIRAFRLENVTDVEFVKKRQTNEPSYFKPRVKIKSPEGLGQSGKIKGIEAMNNNIFQNLKNIGDDLEGKGLAKTAGVITATMSNLLNVKTAQYVGPQGYWIRQKRCWDNCYRQKRTTSPEKAAQVVWTECWSEYNEAINNNQSGWEKYAQEDADLFKYASKEQQDWVKAESQKFAKEVEKKIASGESQGTSIYLTLEENKDEYSHMILADADKLSKIAEKLKENGQDELSEKVANVSMKLLKESQFGGNVGNWGNKLRKLNPFSAKSRAKGLSGDITNRIKAITQQALQMANQFNTIKQQMHQSGKDDMAQQQQWADQDAQQQAKQQNRQQMIDKAKGGVGQAFNWAKDKGQQLINNPAVQQGATALGGSHSNIKTAQPVNPNASNPNYQAGAKEMVGGLREEFQTFLANLRNEGSEMATMATQEQDPQSRQRAQQISQRIMDFDKVASPFEQAFMKNQEMVTQADALVTELQGLANDVNQIQMGQYDPSAATAAPEGTVDPEEPAKMDVGDEAPQTEVPPIEDPIYSDPQADPDSDGFPNEGDGDRNNDSVIDNPEATPQEASKGINQKLESGESLTESEFDQLEAEMDEVSNRYEKALQLQRDRTHDSSGMPIVPAQPEAQPKKKPAGKGVDFFNRQNELYPEASRKSSWQPNKYGRSFLKNVLKKIK